MDEAAEFVKRNAKIIREVLARTDRARDTLTARVREIAEIPSPTFHEEKRTEYLMKAFAEAGLRDVARLPKGSVLAFTKSKGHPNTLLLAAHIDTVFPSTTDLNTRREGSRLYGPGTGDNAANIAAIITLAEIIRDVGMKLDRNVAFCGNVCEESIGNLAGMAEVMDYMGSALGAVIAVDGRMPHVLNRSLAVRRFAVTAHGPGGHAWTDFGRPSAVHEVARVVAEVSRLEVPTEPKTTFNVGTIEGGEGLNSIARGCTAAVELRSIDSESLAVLEGEFLRIVNEVPAPGIEIKTELVGERRASLQPPESDLVRAAVDSARHLGLQPELGAASTDAALPASRGLPAFAMGTYQGGGVHTLEEYVELDSLTHGLKWLALTVLMLASPTGRVHA